LGLIWLTRAMAVLTEPMCICYLFEAAQVLESNQNQLMGPLL
jgi:hypothetical protein